MYNALPLFPLQSMLLADSAGKMRATCSNSLKPSTLKPVRSPGIVRWGRPLLRHTNPRQGVPGGHRAATRGLLYGASRARYGS
jgi:hypothetical protein